MVQVTGLVVEKFGFTQMNVTAATSRSCWTATAVPARDHHRRGERGDAGRPSRGRSDDCGFPAAPAPRGRRAYYETLEGMLVNLPVGVANSGGTNGFAELMVNPGPEQDPVLTAEDPAGTTDAGITSRCSAPSTTPARATRSTRSKDQTSTTTVNADHLDRVENLQGPLTFSFGLYKVVPQEGAMPTIVDGPTEYPFSPRPRPARRHAAGERSSTSRTTSRSAATSTARSSQRRSTSRSATASSTRSTGC